MRVRFAPSPTGALHIGGVRTALFNYLLARKHGGQFILRIEDTDQNRFVPGAENYITEALEWCGLTFDEGPEQGGDYAPYRQSERKPMYRQYAERLVAEGNAYYAFDTAEELEAFRTKDPNFIYNHSTRTLAANSLTLPPDEVTKRIAAGQHYVIRLKVPAEGKVVFNDLIRGEVSFDNSLIDDKVLLKSDGMPTYHLANIVDDHLMKITHVIRGEEWLSSTPHHVLLYRFLGWEDTMPAFSHLPLILKPNGNGKLSKRDGAKFNMPVFPLSWPHHEEENYEGERFTGFREAGFLPEAVINFLALLGWNPGTDQEIFSIEELTEAFSLEKINKSGARFDFEKAKWFNHQYIQQKSDAELTALIQPDLKARGITADTKFVEKFCSLMKSRINVLTEFATVGYYFFTEELNYDEANIQKKWNAEVAPKLQEVIRYIEKAEMADHQSMEANFKTFLAEAGYKPGEILPLMRLALAGTMQGPGVFEMVELLGRENVILRMNNAVQAFNKIIK
ncbi:MAG TPA: glutamate--tRNA ligase [Saprospiraceae bacterium]|nr:glutamate--tRNA ligase [Saprospiraceae bacterium]HMW75242.1 glutamate--tRNA ligase [Saprospiraceae bacterium]HMX82376.1 glutamate--tRNA ligase [Saprospiraceae bacterium]HMX84922.1 glutamate--tRNA ligase [Saprospiraceae bacterium]HMZ73140.1 glutamate--tRNA ligase [Saprospiraceae bacterium]